MAKLNYEKSNRQARGVQYDGAHAPIPGLRAKTKKPAVGRFSKYNEEWVVGVIDTHALPKDGRLKVQKKDGSISMVRLGDYVGSRKLEFCKIKFYSFTKIS